MTLNDGSIVRPRAEEQRASRPSLEFGSEVLLCHMAPFRESLGLVYLDESAQCWVRLAKVDADIPCKA